jgi:hypothetical protein
MTPRSPPQGRPRTASRFNANAMDKWNSSDENVNAVVMSATSNDPRHPPEEVLSKYVSVFWLNK